MHCRYAENTNDGSRLALATTDANVYYGKIDDGFANDLQRTFIAIRNKTTDKVIGPTDVELEKTDLWTVCV